MYCIKCGQRLSDHAKFCSACGTPTQNSNTHNASINITLPKLTHDNILMIVICAINCIMCLSPMIKMYSIYYYQRTYFNFYDLLDKTSGISDSLKSMNLNLDSKDSDMVYFSLFLLGLLIFALFMYAVSAIEAFKEFLHIVSNKPESKGKYWRAAVSGYIALFIANLTTWGYLKLLNALIISSIDIYVESNAQFISVSPIHYIIQVIAIIFYIMSHYKYSDYKNTKEKQSKAYKHTDKD